MARKSPLKPRVTVEKDKDMILVRDRTPVAPPSKEEIEGMKKKAFTRKYPHTSA